MFNGEKITYIEFIYSTEACFNKKKKHVGLVSLPAPGGSWTDWSHVWGGEMRLRKVLEKLNLEYPHDSDD